MASDSDTASVSLPLDAPVASKPKRRSSIFRPDKAGTSRHWDENVFPTGYTNKLVEENIKWQQAYNCAKSEYLHLKKKMEHKMLEVQPTINFKDYEAYLEKVKKLFCQVDNIVVLHEIEKKYLNIRTQELSKEIKFTSKTIHQKLDIRQPRKREP